MATEKTIKVRVLVDCKHGRCNDVAELAASVADAAGKAGLVDAGKDAVAYAADLPQNKGKPTPAASA